MADDQGSEVPDPPASGVTSYVIGMEPGNTLSNVIIGLFYIGFWPVGIPLFIISVVLNRNKAGIIPKAVIALALIAVLGFVAIGLSASPQEPAPTTPEEDVNAWMDDHENLEQRAVSKYQDGERFWDEGRYAAAMNNFQDAHDAYEQLGNEASSKAAEYNQDSRGRMLFSLLSDYYHARANEMSWFADAASEAHNGNDEAAVASLALATDERKAATEHMNRLLEEMGWDQ